MFSNFDEPTRQMLTGNILMVICCAFYLAWWQSRSAWPLGDDEILAWLEK